MPAKSIDGIRPRAGISSSASKHRLAGLVGRSKQGIIAVGATLLVVALTIGVFALTRPDAHTATDEGSVNAIKARVGAHYLLPKDEEPAMATVTDKSKLTTPFLKKAENGDRLLVYQTNHLAIIYRPSIDRIIAVGPVSIDTPPQPQPGSGGEH